MMQMGKSFYWMFIPCFLLLPNCNNQPKDNKVDQYYTAIYQPDTQNLLVQRNIKTSYFTFILKDENCFFIELKVSNFVINGLSFARFVKVQPIDQ